ncbi:hypothetical protein WT01_15755 [Burkholderia cepacia]|nr:hypothetical protein WT01_15755 [Burkholderia cepacia]
MQRGGFRISSIRDGRAEQVDDRRGSARVDRGVSLFRFTLFSNLFCALQIRCMRCTALHVVALRCFAFLFFAMQATAFRARKRASIGIAAIFPLRLARVPCNDA